MIRSSLSVKNDLIYSPSCCSSVRQQRHSCSAHRSYFRYDVSGSCSGREHRRGWRRLAHAPRFLVEHRFCAARNLLNFRWWRWRHYNCYSRCKPRESCINFTQKLLLHISRLCGQTCTKRTVWWSTRLLVFSSGPTHNDVTFKLQATTDRAGKQLSGAVWSTREEWLSTRTRSKLKIQNKSTNFHC